MVWRKAKGNLEEILSWLVVIPQSRVKLRVKGQIKGVFKWRAHEGTIHSRPVTEAKGDIKGQGNHRGWSGGKPRAILRRPLSWLMVIPQSRVKLRVKGQIKGVFKWRAHEGTIHSRPVTEAKGDIKGQGNHRGWSGGKPRAILRRPLSWLMVIPQSRVKLRVEGQVKGVFK